MLAETTHHGGGVELYSKLAAPQEMVYMNELKVDLKLDRIHCYEPGEHGNAEPYLWTVFWKVDGETVVINTDGPSSPFVQGFPVVIGTPGNHGNLGVEEVGKGDDVSIPAIIGEYHTTMSPIRLTSPLGSITDVSGMLGCVVILMEEDNTSDDAVQRGHDALNGAVRDRIADLIGSLSITKLEPTEEDIAAMSQQIGDAVHRAIGDGESVLSWLGGFGDMDDGIGNAVFRFSHSQLEDSGGSRIPFGRRWGHEGDWEILGSITARPLPRREDPCCTELRQRVKNLERAVRTLEELEKRRRLREAAFSGSVKEAVVDPVRQTKPNKTGTKRTVSRAG